MVLHQNAHSGATLRRSSGSGGGSSSSSVYLQARRCVVRTKARAAVPYSIQLLIEFQVI
jgi:hypothetical protein